MPEWGLYRAEFDWAIWGLRRRGEGSKAILLVLTSARKIGKLNG